MFIVPMILHLRTPSRFIPLVQNTHMLKPGSLLFGVVMRNPVGKEVRYPMLLTPNEKQMAREFCIVFRQGVCGFDILRCEGRSYVCDVNGWSFVKNSYKYYDDAACVLRKMFVDAKAPHLSTAIPPILPWKVNEPAQPSEGLTRQGSEIIGSFGQAEELCCVIAIVRHGDRTPKQKVKLKVTEEKLLNIMLKYNGGRPRAETKLKSAVQLQDLLDATRILVPHTRLTHGCHICYNQKYRSMDWQVYSEYNFVIKRTYNHCLYLFHNLIFVIRVI